MSLPRHFGSSRLRASLISPRAPIGVDRRADQRFESGNRGFVVVGPGAEAPIHTCRRTSGRKATDAACRAHPRLESRRAVMAAMIRISKLRRRPRARSAPCSRCRRVRHRCRSIAMPGSAASAADIHLRNPKPAAEHTESLPSFFAAVCKSLHCDSQPGLPAAASSGVPAAAASAATRRRRLSRGVSSRSLMRRALRGCTAARGCRRGSCACRRPRCRCASGNG